MQIVNGMRVGGAELKLLELIENMDRNKFNMTICSIEDIGTLKEAFQKTGYPLHIIPKIHPFDPRLVLKLAQLMQREKTDMAMTTLFYADVIGAYAAKLAKISKCISWETRTHPADSGVGEGRHIYSYRLAMKNVDKIVAVSDAVKKFLIQCRNITPEKILTIRYGIDIDKYNKSDGVQKRKEIEIDQHTFLVGVVARLSEQKGHTYLIDAVSEIIREFPKTKFLFIGDGPLRSQLEDKVSSLQLKSVINFLGSRSDVPELLNAIDLFVLPSLYEGLPNVVLEAMACHKAIVASAVDGTPEAIIHNESGLLVPPKNPNALAKSIMKIISSNDLKSRLEIGARKRAEEEFSIKDQVKKFENLYESLIFN